MVTVASSKEFSDGDFMGVEGKRSRLFVKTSLCFLRLNIIIGGHSEGEVMGGQRCE